MYSVGAIVQMTLANVGDFDKTPLLFLYNHVSPSISELDMEIIRTIPPGGNWEDIPLKTAQKSTRIMQIRESGGRTTYYGRLRTDLPSYTVSTYFYRPGNGSFIHPTQDRMITVREAARLQSFPDSFRFIGPQTSLYKQIGNAVPPLLAYAVGEQIPQGTTVDLFAGAGGLSLGLSWAGHKVIAAAEIEPHMCNTYAENHKETDIMLSDLSKSHEYKHVIGHVLDMLDGTQLNLLVGGPPCQGFSTAGKMDKNDSRNKLFRIMLEAANDLNAESILIENVMGLAWRQGGKVIQSIIHRLSEFGYESRWCSLKAEAYGVPQRRRRVFILGTRSTSDLSLPPPIFSSLKSKRGRKTPELANPDLPPPISVDEAISDLPAVESGGGEASMAFQPIINPTEYQLLMRGIISPDEFLELRAKPPQGNSRI